MDAIIKKLTREDIQAVDSDGLNGQHLVERSSLMLLSSPA